MLDVQRPAQAVLPRELRIQERNALPQVRVHALACAERLADGIRGREWIAQRGSQNDTFRGGCGPYCNARKRPRSDDWPPVEHCVATPEDRFGQVTAFVDHKHSHECSTIIMSILKALRSVR